jgi:multisubunit Na+/H+ antiporter MnhG subunit
METHLNYSVIQLVKKKSTVGTIGKVVGVTIGVCGIILGSLLCLTIVGILIGFPLMVMSLGVIASAQGFQQVTCPHCKKRQQVLKTAENFTCAKCRQVTVINWE